MYVKTENTSEQPDWQESKAKYFVMLMPVKDQYFWESYL